MKAKLIAILVLLAAAFLGGFIPQYQKVSSLEDEVAQAKAEAADRSLSVQLGELRDLVGFVYLETARKNYGNAAQYSTQYFNRVRDLSAATTDERLKRGLGVLLDQRDKITAGLANGEPSVLGDVQDLFFKTHEATKR